MQELIHAAKSGDTDAFATLMQHHYGIALRVAMQILRTHEAAEDAVQDAMIKVWRALPSYEDRNFHNWLLRIVKNTCCDHLKQTRRKKHKASLSLDELLEGDTHEGNMSDFHAWMVDHAANTEEAIVQQESMRELLATIDTLHSWHRNAVWLVDVEGYDYVEAAVILGAPVGTMKSRVSRGRAVLRERIER